MVSSVLLLNKFQLLTNPISTYLCLQLSFHLRHFARVRDGAALAPVDVFVVIEERKAQRAVGAPFVGFKIASYTKVQLM